MNLAQPEPGMMVSPGEEVRREIAEVSARVMELLREQKPGQLHMMLPEGRNTQYVQTRPKFWSRVLGTAPSRVSIVQLIEEVFEPLEVTEWPDPLEDMTVLYEGKGRLAGLYEIPHNWPDSPAGSGMMELEVHVYKSTSGWKLHTLRFYGDAFEAVEIRREEE